MAAWRCVRQFDFVVPLLLGAMLATAAAGCNDSTSSSPAPPAQGVAAASATPETFRNLGKRGESVF